MIMDFIGLSRVLTIIARGYMFRNGIPDIEYARRALCAWCSIPDKKTAAPKEEWQFRTDFSDLHEEFPELVDKKGQGWFYMHVHKIENFITKNSDKMSKTTLSKSEPLKKKFDSAWRDKVKQFQISLYPPDTKGAWVLRFDDVLADALELGLLVDMIFSSLMMKRLILRHSCQTVCHMKLRKQSLLTVLSTNLMIRTMLFFLSLTSTHTSAAPISAESGSICSLILCLNVKSRVSGFVG